MSVTDRIPRVMRVLYIYNLIRRKGKTMDLRIRDIKNIIKGLPDDMLVVIPVVDDSDVDHIYAFRKVRTAGILVSDHEDDREVLCLNGATDGYDIADQIDFSQIDVDVKEILAGISKFNKEKKQ